MVDQNARSIRGDAVSELAASFGLRRYPRSWRGRCPCCSYPGNTFSMKSGKSGRITFYCANGCTYEALAAAVQSATATSIARSKREAADLAAARGVKREQALRLWRGAEPAPETLADRYLIGRALPGLAASPVLRFRGDTPHPERGRLPALLALVTDAAGEPIAVQRTFLDCDGRKAKIEPQKASLGPVWGGAIHLDPLDPDKPLVIGEGIETSASAGRLIGAPAWAAISAGNLERGLVLPPEVHRVVIAADPDEAGERAALAAARRWQAEGREVRIMRPTGGGDFNEVVQRRAAREAT